MGHDGDVTRARARLRRSDIGRRRPSRRRRGCACRRRRPPGTALPAAGVGGASRSCWPSPPRPPTSRCSSAVSSGRAWRSGPSSASAARRSPAAFSAGSCAPSVSARAGSRPPRSGSVGAVLLATSADTDDGGENVVAGLVLAVGAGVAYAVYLAASRALLDRHGPDDVTAVVFAGAGLVLLPGGGRDRPRLARRSRRAAAGAVARRRDRRRRLPAARPGPGRRRRRRHGDAHARRAGHGGHPRDRRARRAPHRPAAGSVSASSWPASSSKPSPPAAAVRTGGDSGALEPPNRPHIREGVLPAWPAVLAVRNLSVEVGGTLVLEGAGFTVRAGDTVGLVGRNGAGKTSLLKVLGGMAPPKAGAVHRPAAFGYLPQDPRLDGVPDDVTPVARVLGGRGLDEIVARMEKLRLRMEESPGDESHRRPVEPGPRRLRARRRLRRRGRGPPPPRRPRAPARPRRPAHRRAVGRRAAPGRAGPHPVRRHRPAHARRADQPPRQRRPRLAARLPPGLPGRAARRLPRHRAARRLDHPRAAPRPPVGGRGRERSSSTRAPTRST